jgi:hypothetical protein
VTSANRDGKMQRLLPVGRQVIHIDGAAHHRAKCIRYGLATKGVQRAILQVSQPGREPISRAATSFRHPGQAEIDAICENLGEQRRSIVGGSPAALMGEAFRKAGPSIDLQQQIGDLDSGHQVVGGLRQRPNLGRLLRLQWPDPQQAGVQGHVVQRARFSPCGHVRHRVGQ